MRLQRESIFCVVIVAVLVAGCAAYRTDSDISFESTDVGKRDTAIIISEDSLPGRKFQELGLVEAEVKKLTIFHRDPTKEQVNIILAEKAKQMKADAVINVKYESGVGFTTWGYMTGKGMGVKLSEREPVERVTLVNPKTGESVTCPWEGIVTRAISVEQAAQERAWHAEFQRTHNRLPTPMEGCLKGYEISGFVRTATEGPLRPKVAPADRLYTNPVYRWSISYPSSWTIDSRDHSFIRISSSADSALCGIHSGAVPFKTVDEFTDTILANTERSFRDRGHVFVISARQQISLPNDIIGIDVLTGIGAGGKSRRVYILVDPRGFVIDCETYAKDWDRLAPFYDRIVRSFTLGK